MIKEQNESLRMPNRHREIEQWAKASGVVARKGMIVELSNKRSEGLRE